MPRKDLDRADAELREVEERFKVCLAATLKEVAAGRNINVFFTDEYNPHSLPAHMLPNQTRELMQMARTSIELRRLLALPTDQCRGTLFIDACKESAELA